MMIKGRSMLSVLLLLAAVIPAIFARAAAEPALEVAPGDRIGVKVMGYTDLDAEYDVRADGTVHLPLVGALPLAGLPGAQAESLVVAEFWQHLLARPQILVAARHRVSVLGEVKTPGIYYVNGTERVADLMARAGGPTQSARLKSVRVTRNGETVKTNVAAALSSGETLATVGLRSGDVLYVPKSRSFFDLRILTALISAAYVTVSLIDRINQ